MGRQNGRATLEDSLAFHRKLNIDLLYNATILPLDSYSDEVIISVHTKACTWMFTAALFIIHTHIASEKKMNASESA